MCSDRDSMSGTSSNYGSNGLDMRMVSTNKDFNLSRSMEISR